MARIYVADIDPIFIRSVRMAFAGCRESEIVGDSGSGLRALADVRRLRPDVLLTDVQLPEMDGIALLRQVRRLAHPPAVVVCTRFYSCASMDWAYRYGASYFLCKPVDYDSLPRLLSDCAAAPAPVAVDDAQSGERERRAAGLREILTDFGISPKLNGCAYLIESVLRAREDALLLRNLSRGLYVELARSMGSTVPRVERSLRSAIDIAYERGSLKSRFSSRPSNKQFIEYLLKETLSKEGAWNN